VTERREKLQNESDALDLMIQNLRDVFPSQSLTTNSQTKKKTDFPSSNLGKPLTGAESTFNIGSPEERRTAFAKKKYFIKMKKGAGPSGRIFYKLQADN
jgi:hypothetical protein